MQNELIDQTNEGRTHNPAYKYFSRVVTLIIFSFSFELLVTEPIHSI